MGIGRLQVGQDFANPVAELDQESQNLPNSGVNSNSTRVEQAQDLSVSAEIERVNEAERVEVSPEEIASAVSGLNEFVQNNSRQLNFSIDEGSERQVVRVTDTDSGEVIRQIPSEEILQLSERLRDLQTDVGTAVGLLFNRQV